MTAISCNIFKEEKVASLLSSLENASTLIEGSCTTPFLINVYRSTESVYFANIKYQIKWKLFDIQVIILSAERN